MMDTNPIGHHDQQSEYLKKSLYLADMKNIAVMLSAFASSVANSLCRLLLFAEMPLQGI
jgi:hypothetical protein